MCNVGAGKSLLQALKVHSVEEGRKEKHQSFPVHLHCLTAWLPACLPSEEKRMDFALLVACAEEKRYSAGL